MEENVTSKLAFNAFNFEYTPAEAFLIEKLWLRSLWEKELNSNSPNFMHTQQ